MRTPLIVANWKMNGTKLMVQEWLQVVTTQLSASSTTDTAACEWVFCPPSVYLDAASMLIKAANLSTLCLGAQNCHTAAHGAFTGEISANMLIDVGCRYVLVGHSERRQLFKESNAIVAEKIQAAQQAGLIPILCVGETAAERQSNRTQTVIETQLAAALNDCQDKTKIGIAYEPLWAIGTGLTATPEQAQVVHQQIRGWLAKNSKGLAGVVESSVAVNYV